MFNTRQKESKRKISDRTKTELLSLTYSKYVSRCHTLLSLFFEGITAIIFGTIGIILSLVEIDYIVDFNEYYFLQTIRFVFFVSLIYGGTIFSMWLYAKQRINKIIERIENLDAC